MKKIFLGTCVFAFAFLLVGCGGSKSQESTFKKHNKDKNALECTAKEGSNEATVYIYFDKDNKITSFDYYMDLSAGTATKEDVKDAEEIVCNGKGEFKKEWLDECSYELDGDRVKAHVYVNNGEWFGDYQTKDEIKNLDEGDFQGFTCVEK